MISIHLSKVIDFCKKEQVAKYPVPSYYREGRNRNIMGGVDTDCLSGQTSGVAYVLPHGVQYFFHDSAVVSAQKNSLAVTTA